VACGAEWLELDVRLSRDQVAVVFHDEDLNRLTGRPDLTCDLTAAELAATPLCVPTLADVIRGVPSSVSIYVEMKADAARPDDEGRSLLLERCLELVGPDSVHALGSFDSCLVRGSLAAGRRTVLGVSMASELDVLAPGEAEQLLACCVQWGALDEALVDRVREIGAELWTWTVDGEAAIDHVMQFGVDAICTNDVTATRQILAARGQSRDSRR